jgi:nucleoside-diphosphate-sugar epimerase
MKRVLITGGKGYIARNLVPLFEAGGYEVDAPSRTELDLLDSVDKTVEYLTKSSPSVIIHAAAKGGRRTQKDTWEDVYVPNIRMFERLYLANMRPDKPRAKVIIIGSGAEFDRRYPIQNSYEGKLFNEWPIDPYGLSKNIIARRALTDFQDMYVLRLFGCFNWDDDPTRFIKAGILNLKRGLAVEVHQNKEMDYFYLDDIYTVIDFIIQNEYAARNINLVYPEKLRLLDIASLIHKHVGKFDPIIKLNDNEWADPYTGNGNILAKMPVKLIGLEEGIRRTVLKLT